MPSQGQIQVNAYTSNARIPLKDVAVTITLSASDMGKVIGRQGKIAKALRTLVRAGSQKDNVKYNIEIKERGEVE